MNHDTTSELAQIVDDAAIHASPITMLTAEHPDFSLEEAYDVQRASMARRYTRGEKLIGMKMGLTSHAKMEQMGVHNPIYGHLTDKMAVSNGGGISRAEHCHPRVEPEIAFILKHDLQGPVTSTEALEAVEWVVAALEVIDSRYQDFKFTLNDVVADNASSTRFVLGESRKRPDDLDLSNLGMVMSHNGKVAETGSSAAIIDHPARSLATLANMLAERGERLHAGQVVLAGASTKAIFVEQGDHVRLEVQELGTVDVFVKA